MCVPCHLKIGRWVWKSCNFLSVAPLHRRNMEMTRCYLTPEGVGWPSLINTWILTQSFTHLFFSNVKRVINNELWNFNTLIRKKRNEVSIRDLHAILWKKSLFTSKIWSLQMAKTRGKGDSQRDKMREGTKGTFRFDDFRKWFYFVNLIYKVFYHHHQGMMRALKLHCQWLKNSEKTIWPSKWIRRIGLILRAEGWTHCVPLPSF